MSQWETFTDVRAAQLWRSFYAAEAAWEGREDPVFYMQEPPERSDEPERPVLPAPRGLTGEFLDRLYGPRQVQR